MAVNYRRHDAEARQLVEEIEALGGRIPIVLAALRRVQAGDIALDDMVTCARLVLHMLA